MSEHCHCGCHHEEPHHELNKYEQAFAKFDAPMSDEQVHAAVTKLFEERKAEYNTPETLRQFLLVCPFNIQELLLGCRIVSKLFQTFEF